MDSDFTIDPQFEAMDTDSLIQLAGGAYTEVTRLERELNPHRTVLAQATHIILKRMVAEKALAIPDPVWNVQVKLTGGNAVTNAPLLFDKIREVRTLAGDPLPAEEIDAVATIKIKKELVTNVTALKTMVKKYGAAVEAVYKACVTYPPKKAVLIFEPKDEPKKG